MEKLVFEQTSNKKIKEKKHIKINWRPIIIIPLLFFLLAYGGRVGYYAITGYDYFTKIDNTIHTKLANLPLIIDEKFDDEANIFYSQLNDWEKSVYKALYDGGEKKANRILVRKTGVRVEDIKGAIKALLAYYPEYYWFNYSYSYYENSYGNMVIEFNESANDSVNIDDTLANYLKDSEYETALAIHDYVIEKLTYTLNCEHDQDYRSALYTDKAVCAGYASLFQIIAKRCGLECYYIVGSALGNGHAWNLIKIDGQYYWVDTTWDDSSEKYLFFLVGDDLFLKGHILEDDFTYPVCSNALANVEYEKNGGIAIEDLNEVDVDQLMIDELKKNKKVSVRFNKTSDYEKTFDRWFNQKIVNDLVFQITPYTSFTWSYNNESNNIVIIIN